MHLNIQNPMLYLASGSPRRRELLDQVGYSYEQISIEIDESILLAESAQEYVKRMAIVKSDQALKKLESSSLCGWILSADTIISVDRKILGKPKNYDDYCAIMQQLSNNTHEVYSAISVLKVAQGELIDRVLKLNCNRVIISSLPKMFIDYYWDTGEPKDKAGGYAIQGRMASYIKQIEGSYSGIMGLPLYDLREALEQLGYNHSE